MGGGDRERRGRGQGEEKGDIKGSKRQRDVVSGWVAGWVVE